MGPYMILKSLSHINFDQSHGIDDLKFDLQFSASSSSVVKYKRRFLGGSNRKLVSYFMSHLLIT